MIENIVKILFSLQYFQGGKPNNSKYDEYFEIDHITKQAACRICQKSIRKNCYGMRGHLSSKHQINIEENRQPYNDVEEYETSIPLDNIKLDMDVIDANDFYEDVEQPYGDENEISYMPQDIGFTVCTKLEIFLE